MRARGAPSTPPSTAASYFMPSRSEFLSPIAVLLLSVGLFDADLAFLFELELGYRCTVDLVRAVCQAQDARLGPEGGQRGVPRDARPAEGLDGAAEDAQGGVGGDDIHLGATGAARLVAHP